MRRAGIRSSACLALAILLCGCGRETPARIRVTLIGIDGASWRVIDDLLARGELPHIAALAAAGGRAPLRSIRPLLSPAVWTTIATGRSRAHHGIRKFNRRQGGLVSSRDRRVPALWTRASEQGLRSAVIGWWATYPAEAIDGVVVSERALKTRDDDVREMVRAVVAPPEASGLVHPPEVMAAVADLIGAEPETVGGERERVVRVMQSEDAAVIRSLMRLREPFGPFDLEMLLLRGVDPVSHHFWKFREPDAPAYRGRRPPPEELERYSGAIDDHYRYVDRLLAELGAVGARDQVVMLLSDHGFEAGHQKHRGGVLSGTHKSDAAIDGIFLASGGPFLRGVRLERISIRDIAPTTLHLLALPVPDLLEGEVATSAMDPDWLEEHPITRAPSLPPPPGGPTRRSPGSDEGALSPADERIEDELRALGYIE
jgi:predicted AlkP superfamily phosphohydrolase/phosphomutase